ncbi:SDR family oxidoreductase [Alcaligenaceae bacterium]|nr:SDR family oxidoreductase [Alcaligenaceae bacterium]
MSTLLTTPNFSLAGKLALITGSTQGLGREIAQAYAASGASVIINGRDQARVDNVVQYIREQGGQAYSWVNDISQLVETETAFVALCEQLGAPDILVNNVGIRIRKSLSEASLNDILELINVDLMASVQLSRLAANAMVYKAQPGRILTMTSIAGGLARAGDAIYPIAKQGLAGMIRALAVEYGPYGITSNGIAPGTFATETNLELSLDPIKGPVVVGRNPMSRWGQPHEITGAAVFLASSSAAYVNGHILVVDGGFSITF